MVEALAIRIMRTTTAYKLTLPSWICYTRMIENSFRPASMIAEKKKKKEGKNLSAGFQHELNKIHSHFLPKLDTLDPSKISVPTLALESLSMMDVETIQPHSTCDSEDAG